MRSRSLYRDQGCVPARCSRQCADAKGQEGQDGPDHQQDAQALGEVRQGRSGPSKPSIGCGSMASAHE